MLGLSLLLFTFHNQYNFETQKNFKNCIGDCQTVINPILNVKTNNFSLFGGLNSISEPMLGLRHETDLTRNIAITYGAYFQNNEKYVDRGLHVGYSIDDVVPLVGLDIHGKDYGLVITPVTTSFYIKF